MKLSGKALVFRVPTFWPTRRRVWFLRRGNTIQLLDTAMVLEGYVQRFSLPILDVFFRRALSEWTTVTIPYSRIVDYRFRSKRLARWLWTLAVWSPVAFLGLVALSNYTKGWNAIDSMVAMMGFSPISVVLTAYFFKEGLTPRNVLQFLPAEGKRKLIVFSIRDKARQRAFHDLLVANRAAAGDKGVAG